MNTGKKYPQLSKVKSTKKLINGKNGFDKALASLGVTIRFTQHAVNELVS